MTKFEIEEMLEKHKELLAQTPDDLKRYVIEHIKSDTRFDRESTFYNLASEINNYDVNGVIPPCVAQELREAFLWMEFEGESLPVT